MARWLEWAFRRLCGCTSAKEGKSDLRRMSETGSLFWYLFVIICETKEVGCCRNRIENSNEWQTRVARKLFEREVKSEREPRVTLTNRCESLELT